jgi:hypothetical protein
METRFATNSGCVRNTAIVEHPHLHAQQAQPSNAPPPVAETVPSGLGGQLADLAAALNVIGWNHNQVPAEERIPPQERL